MTTLLFIEGFSIAAIEGWLIALLPALTAIGTIFYSLYKIIKTIGSMKSEYASLKQSVEDKTELKEVKAEMSLIIKQNAVLRKELEKLITTQSGVKYDGPKENK
jgi:sensor histidine kinase YesM